MTMGIRMLATEALYWVANQCCYLADKIEPKLWQPTTLNGQPVSATNTLIFGVGERGRILGPDGMWHEVGAQEFPWTPRIVE
jgi:hypothetical protein